MLCKSACVLQAGFFPGASSAQTNGLQFGVSQQTNKQASERASERARHCFQWARRCSSVARLLPLCNRGAAFSTHYLLLSFVGVVASAALLPAETGESHQRSSPARLSFPARRQSCRRSPRRAADPIESLRDNCARPAALVSIELRVRTEAGMREREHKRERKRGYEREQERPLQVVSPLPPPPPRFNPC